MNERLPATPADHVLIVGAGFSGTLLAVNLLRHGGPRVTLAERRPAQVGRGVAYSAADDSHLLNVRAGNMSAFPDDRDHFARWLAARGEGDRHSFVRRTTYGAYLAELLADAARASGGRLRLVEREVVAIERSADTLTAHWASGDLEAFDRAVLALGNLPPHAPPGVDPHLLPADIYCDDPWASDIADGLTDRDDVLLLGTGLTAIDAALLLARRGYRGRITAMSRRGLHPRAHDDAQPGVEPRGEIPSRHLSALVRDVRRDAARVGWRCAVDALRPVTQLLWSGADIDTRRRFLRHLRPFWDVHRHRLATSIAADIDAMVATGRLSFRSGKLASIAADGDGARIAFRPRGGDAIETARYRRIVNCTGPQGDLLRTHEPLLRQLHAQGTIRPDVARLGIDIAPSTAVVTADGTAHPRLHAIGPMTRGAYWEVVAVPDIRVQCWNLARALANAHWVGGEGL